MLLLDYSQNYPVVTQNEVQAAFFGQRQISIFTAMGYIDQNPPISIIIVNDDISHKHQVWFYEKIIMEFLKTKNPRLSHVRFLTDGCAGQFKNKFTLANMLFSQKDFGVTAEWHFSPTSHGKRPADGLGATYKRNVHDRVMTGDHQV